MKEWAKIKKINTKRLILRHINLNDINDLYEYNSDQDNVFWIEINPFKNILEAKNSIKNYFLNSPIGKFGIILKSINKLIGVIEIRKDNTYQIGYILNKKFENNGYMYEALFALLDVALNKLNIEFIEIHIAKDNIKSNKLVSKFNPKVYSSFFKYRAKQQKEIKYNIYRIYKGDLNE